MTADDIKALVEQLGHRLYGPGECTLPDIGLISQSETAIATLTLENQRLRVDAERTDAIINSPQSNDFLRAVSIEAEHQRRRWGSVHDAGKTNPDWNALIAYLLGKALTAMATGNREKSEHHVITAAAVLENWHAAVTGQDNSMRPGYADGGHPGVVGDAALCDGAQIDKEKP